MPLNFNRIILAEFHAIVPQLETKIRGTQRDLDDVIDAVVLLPRVPPMAVLEFEHGERETREVGRDIAEFLAGCRGSVGLRLEQWWELAGVHDER